MTLKETSNYLNMVPQVNVAWGNDKDCDFQQISDFLMSKFERNQQSFGFGLVRGQRLRFLVDLAYQIKRDTGYSFKMDQKYNEFSFTP